MKRPDDIYNAESIPPMARRRRRSDRRRNYEARAAGAGAGSGGPSGETLGSGSSSRHWRRHAKRAEGGRWKGVLWLALAVLLVLYLGFLVFSYFRGEQAKADRKTKPDKKAAAAGPAANAAPGDEQAAEKLVAGALAAREALTTAEVQQTRENKDRARDALDAALARYPDHLELQFARAELFLQDRQYPQTIQLLTAILQAQPDNMKARLKLAHAYFASNNLHPAQVIIDWTLPADPYSSAALDCAVSIALARQNYQDAIRLLDRIIALDRENADAVGKLAMAYMQIGELNKAIELYKPLTQQPKADSAVFYNLALCYVRQPDSTNAMAVLESAAELYDSAFIDTWLQAKEFAPLNPEPRFQALRQKVGQGLATPVAPAQP